MHSAPDPRIELNQLLASGACEIGGTYVTWVTSRRLDGHTKPVRSPDQERKRHMGIFDKAKQFADDNPDKVNQGIDKGGDAIDERTGGKHAEHVDKAQDAARKRFGGEGDQPQQ